MKNPIKTVAAAIKEVLTALDESMPQVPQPAPKPKGGK